MASKWDVSSVLSSMYYLFTEAPARQDDYKTASGSSVSFGDLQSQVSGLSGTNTVFIFCDIR